MKLDAEQFDKLLMTIGTEPSLSFSSGSLWVAAMSLLVAIAVLFLAKAEYIRATLEVDAKLIMESFQEYEKLFDSLNEIRSLASDNYELLQKFRMDLYDPNGFELIKNNQIDENRWKEARSTKSFFKCRLELVGKKFFSEKAISISVDRWGADLVRKELFQLDVLIFYQTRLSGFENGQYTEKELSDTFSSDFAWYVSFPDFMHKQKAKYGWNRSNLNNT